MTTTRTALCLALLFPVACGSAARDPVEPTPKPQQPKTEEHYAIEVRAAALSEEDALALFITPPALVAYAAWELFDANGSRGYTLTGDTASLVLSEEPDGTLLLSGNLAFGAPPDGAVVEQNGLKLAVPQVLIFQRGTDVESLHAVDPAALDDSAWLGLTFTDLLYIAPESMDDTLASEGYVAGVNQNATDENGTRLEFADVTTTTAAQWRGFGQEAIPLIR